MRLGTLRDGSRDGALVVVDGAGKRVARAAAIAPNLQAALDDWPRVEPALRELAARLEVGAVPSQPLEPARFSAPLPRAYEWIDGSAYLNHIRLVRRARNAALPEGLESDPLVYQGGSGVLLGPTDPLRLPPPGAGGDVGLDFEAEVAVVLGDVPVRVPPADAASYVRLVMLANDVTYRNLVAAELAKGFGFFVSKPATAFSPFVVTPDELGAAWDGARVALRLRSTYNGAVVGDVDTGPEMHFSFADLISHAARTRALAAGTILGSGTVSNAERARGVSCLVERRMIETIDGGAPTTPYMKPGDRIRIEAFDAAGRSPFGAIEQVVEAAETAEETAR